jgi:copper chaperone CopZ
MADRIDFMVVGDRKIHCVSCETMINFSLKRVPGIEQVTPDAKTQRVAVNFDRARISTEQVQDKLKEIGFDVEKINP